MQVVLPDGWVLERHVFPSGNWQVGVRQVRPGMDVDPPPPAARRGGPQVYIPYTIVHPLTVAGAPADAVWVDVSSGPFAYFGALLSWWWQGADFAVVEHDVVCRPDVVEAFAECPEPWCQFGYHSMCHEACMEAWRNELGCTRFRAELIAAVPDAVSSIPTDGWDWHNLCDGLGGNLRRAGFSHHWHFPPVRHHRMRGD